MTSYPYPILDYERAEDPKGELIPLCMRMKLDLAGYKIGLGDWQALPRTARDVLLSLAVDTDADVRAFKQELARALKETDDRCPEALPSSHSDDVAQWKAPREMPSAVEHLAHEFNVDVKWERLDLFARYVLWYLAKKGKARRFLSMCHEFQSHR